MVAIFRNWFRKYFSNEEAVVVLVLLVGSLLTILMLGNILAPLLAGGVIAYVLQGLVARIHGTGLPHLVSVIIVFLLFLGATIAFLILLLPLVLGQLTSFIREIPLMVINLQEQLRLLPEKYPQFFNNDTIFKLSSELATEVSGLTQWLLSFSLSSIPVLVTVLIYCVLVPILVFFFLKDRDLIVSSLGRLLPAERAMMTRIWYESNIQFANYIRGKVLEILIVGITSWVAFVAVGVDYATLLAVLVGLSVVIPFIGAAVVTIPVAMIGLIQWGWGPDFIWLMAVYGIIQALDGNVLVPLLFSEVVNLHPVVIISSVVLFGGLWGLWGVFFAIPLATLLKAVFSAWPTGMGGDIRPVVDASGTPQS